jgi:hypothetical protein
MNMLNTLFGNVTVVIDVSGVFFVVGTICDIHAYGSDWRSGIYQAQHYELYDKLNVHSQIACATARCIMAE